MVDAFEFSKQDLERLELFCRQQRLQQMISEARAKEHFLEWIRLHAIVVLDKLESAWKFVRQFLGFDLD